MLIIVAETAARLEGQSPPGRKPLGAVLQPEGWRRRAL